ncbi:hypothetical protein Tsp_15633 [Trichinella spiralis]|uniref:hypothetical protein n=1 Tax=Trichinella spiralis TaxID=6334 RepID=UPI0001EFEDF2|nr:hypothetical protein Tsp_15633 [Trichinella spiralis]
MTGLAVVAAAAARSLRKYAKHASSCFIQCCVVFVVRRSDVAAGACVFFTLPTSLRRQGGIFRCPKISKKCRSECAHKGWRVVSGVCACAMYAVTITLAKQIVSVCPFGDFNVQFIAKPVSISLHEQSKKQTARNTTFISFFHKLFINIAFTRYSAIIHIWQVVVRVDIRQ